MYDNGKSGTNIIAVCGKGGVGKTSVSAMFVKILSEKSDSKILAIDADPAVGLASALGFNVNKTIDDIRNSLIQRIDKGEGGDRREIVSMLDYEVFDALEEKGNLAFLAIGRPENDGCYCQVNEFLKEIIKSVSGNFDYVVIDGEAGIEQVNRRVMDEITHLLLVSDASRKGINVVKSILDVASGKMGHKQAALLLNRIQASAEAERIEVPEGITLTGQIPEDNEIREADMLGKSILEITDCPALRAAGDFLQKLLR